MIADFADSYAAGETPVPCVRCNQTVKFTDLTALARGLGAERLATGHYVRRVDGPDGPELHRAADPARDQSWFLFATTRAQLAILRCSRWAACRTRRRCGAMAARLGLAGGGQAGQPGHLLRPGRQLRRCGGTAAAGRRGAGRDRRPRRAGARAGTTASRATPWARRSGSAPRRGRGRSGRWWWRPSAARRRVVVGPRDDGHRPGAAARGELADRRRRTAPLRCQVKLRAREAPHGATVRATADGAEVRLDAPALPAPGQACVFYDGEPRAGRRVHPAGGGGVAVYRPEYATGFCRPGVRHGPAYLVMVGL